MLALPETVQCRSLYINTLPVIFCSSDECKSFGSSSLLLKRVCPICISCFQRFSSSRVPASAWRGAPLASTRADHSYAVRNLMAIVARQIPVLNVMDRVMSSAATSPALIRPNTSNVAVMAVSSPPSKPLPTWERQKK
jgi:hypothetical protein